MHVTGPETKFTHVTSILGTLNYVHSNTYTSLHFDIVKNHVIYIYNHLSVLLFVYFPDARLIVTHHLSLRFQD